MRPILLEIEAFGPFAKLQKIDFDLLKETNMFLIHGATGGGKTTILDAICYALYGVTSGDEREARAMRSHFAKADQLTQVKLTFKVGQDTYYVHRIPGQERPKKIGEGFTYQNPDAQLYIIEDNNEKRQIASNVSRVTEKVIEIIGFDADQFRQVIMIPQGKFRDLLVAKSEERQKILGEIFQTRKYRQIEDEIRLEERNLRREVVTSKDRRIGQIKNIKYKQDSKLAKLIESDSIDPDKVISQVELLCKEQEEKIKKIDKEIEAYNKSLTKLANKITIATNNNEKYNEKLKAKKTYDKLEEEKKLYKEKEEEYNLAQKALPLRAKEKYIKDLMKEKDQREEEVNTITKKLNELEKTYIKVKEEKESYSQKEKEIKKCEIELNTALKEYRPKLIELINLEKERDKLLKKIEESKEKDEELKNKKQELDKKIKSGEINLKKRQDFNDNLRRQELELEKLSTSIIQKKDLLDDEKSHRKLQIQYKKIDVELKEAKYAYAQVSKAHNDLVQQWIRGQAGELAKGLEENKQCPVCGSTNHPNPAKTDSNTVTEDEVNKMKSKLDRSEKLYLKHEKEHVRIFTEGKKSKDLVDSKRKALGKYADISLKDIEEKHKILDKEKNKTIESLKELETIEKLISNYKEENLKLDQEISTKGEEDREYSNKLTGLQAQINRINKEIPEELRKNNELDKYISRLEKIIEDYNKAYNKIKKDLENLDSNRIQLGTSQNEKTNQIKSLKKRYSKENNEFIREREKLGFISFEDYENAYKSQEMLDKLDSQIKDYNNLYSVAKAQYIKLEKETENIKLANLEELNNSYSELERDRDQISRLHQTIIIEKQHNEGQIKTILESSKKIKKKEERYKIVGDLYKAVRGDNVKGLSFERFIQSSLFEDVLIRANERLTLMSNNRYKLYRSDNRETKASHAGLDLEVLDTYTGKKRHVRTLSGGEGFMASLSLALGLADVVQSYAGGVSLETIFIDEGFGTLDVESLDAAIGTLINLQQSGRLVGIISHVPELKDRIGARLEVVASQSGSSAEFHI